MGDAEPDGAALQHGPWRNRIDLSSALAHGESFLSRAGFDRAPWTIVALGAGIAAWFLLPTSWHWLAWASLCLSCGLLGLALIGPSGNFPYIRQSLVVMTSVAAAGTLLVWGKSSLVGTPPIARPMVAVIDGTVLDRDEQPAQHRVRLTLATREPGTARPIKVRLNLDLARDRMDLVRGTTLKLRARLVPPAPPMLPGGYDFARSAWFSGLAATGSVLGDVTVLSRGGSDHDLARIQQALSQHVRANLGGSPGTIAAAFASGDRGAIAAADEEAMRDAGLTHLLSISGLHVSAVIAAAYVLALRLLGLIPWLALRVRLPLVAAASGAVTGIGYTLLTGAEVPTIRSCIGALLVLVALALGREALSMRMVAVGAGAILLIWPEALVGPSFQMSFAAVTAIVALHSAPRIKALFQAREEPWYAKLGRQVGSLLLTGIVIELALMPIGLFHFHRAGVYGALANVVAIPLTTFVSMPLIALALLFDTLGLGAPLWWLAGKSLELLLALAHWTASFPGAVTLLPAMGGGALALFVLGGLWLALWRDRVRLLGLAPAILGAVLLSATEAPDVLVSGDGRHVGITGEGRDLLVLRDSRSDFARDNLSELAGMNGEVRLIADWPGGECNADFCALRLDRSGRAWDLLIARGKDYVDERALAAVCDRVDVVIAARYLPRSCRPRWIKADRRLLDRSGGLAIDLDDANIRTVAQGQGQHGWWNPQARVFSVRPLAPDASRAPRPTGPTPRD
ncbi:competence protein ComEC [Novosphingobium kunmingense]|uniref:Competence protein ComEC n=2 Tax=Novosphingobium kunmingense TaxID=1211806 RepID=A0A2N0I303_9SPHN|nr:competence protein ComEC [Novosphingobium kunmingense]